MEIRKKVLANGKGTVHFKVLDVIGALRFQNVSGWNKVSDGLERFACALENIDPWIVKVEGKYKAFSEVLEDAENLQDCMDIVLEMMRGKSGDEPGDDTSPGKVSEPVKKPAGKQRRT